ncbi:hypothetical protein A3A39_00495 [Candidatus Kaiserbacteria bacterium RIFCSPLOWO2_01_FULL_54_13]|uniref:Pilus assembly protein PilO n=1 Tax=Candidatus Kaiserbacteria bacterium RIFCSPLOWO2_01_FULL_54_13 TaxID=1798512 RepID=A0A1F6F0N9_9BACT|nr:MAG: hypothetical protein A3A39_00495 [Candidatus Kaiserbacteria bacterium RIFCSPLOWO2_01_FULL_54_13]
MVKVILSTLGLAIAGGIFFLYTQPRYDAVRTLQAEIEQYNQALEKAAELQRLKQSLLSRYNAFSPSDVDRLHKLLPDHVDNVRLVLDLDSLASRHGMAIQNVVISNPTTEKALPGAISTIGVNRQKYDSLILKFRTLGTYTNFTAFLRDLETSLRIVDLVSLKLLQDSGLPTQPRVEPTYRYEITLRTYWLK